MGPFVSTEPLVPTQNGAGFASSSLFVLDFSEICSNKTLG